mmetsp:Transcript_80401/g.167461  ORF Transcript_80401/g.167461 Transcript_80401/m.167461 type:complete len:145 (+) Transcript_80401:1-435(+)
MWLVQQGHSDPNAKNNAGHTSLHLAARNAPLEVVAWLMQAGPCRCERQVQRGRHSTIYGLLPLPHRRAYPGAAPKGWGPLRSAIPASTARTQKPLKRCWCPLRSLLDESCKSSHWLRGDLRSARWPWISVEGDVLGLLIPSGYG